MCIFLLTGDIKSGLCSIMLFINLFGFWVSIRTDIIEKKLDEIIELQQEKK